MKPKLILLLTLLSGCLTPAKLVTHSERVEALSAAATSQRCAEAAYEAQRAILALLESSPAYCRTVRTYGFLAERGSFRDLASNYLRGESRLSLADTERLAKVSAGMPWQ